MPEDNAVVKMLKRHDERITELEKALKKIQEQVSRGPTKADPAPDEDESFGLW